MKLMFLGADHEVTGSCHYIEACGKSILLDCGMEQGRDTYENQEIPVAAGRIDYVFLSHAHIDHSGLLPLLHKNGFQGQIYATEATTDLCRIMLLDSAHIQEFEAPQRPPQTSAASCFWTVRIFRNLKRSGATAKISVPAKLPLSRFIPQRMRWQSWSILFPAII